MSPEASQSAPSHTQVAHPLPRSRGPPASKKVTTQKPPASTFGDPGAAIRAVSQEHTGSLIARAKAVSYTHLTLPTIYSV